MKTLRNQLKMQDEVIATFEERQETGREVECMTSPYYNAPHLMSAREQEREEEEGGDSGLLDRYALNGKEFRNLTFRVKDCRDSKKRFAVYSNFEEVFVLYGDLQYILYSEKLSDEIDLNSAKISNCKLVFSQKEQVIAFTSNSETKFAVLGKYFGFTKRPELEYVPVRERSYTEL